MALVLLKVKDKVVEARYVKDTNLQIEGYLEGLKRDMMEHNEEVMDLTESSFEVRKQTFSKEQWFPFGNNLLDSL